MGFVVETLATQRGEPAVTYVEIKADMGGGQVETAPLFLPPGMRALPLPGDTVEFVPSAGTTGGYVCLGAIDTVNALQLNDGEAEIYGRDAEGLRVSSVRVLGDGSVVFNDGTDFAIQYNAMKTAFDQLITDYNAHGHGGMGAAPPTPTTADMSGAKVATVKLP